MKYQPNVEQLFGKHACFYLPKLLNTYKVSVIDFQEMRFNGKVPLVKALLMYFRMYQKPEPKMVYQLRRYKPTGDNIMDCWNLLDIASVHNRDVPEPLSSATKFRAMLLEILNRSHIYDHRLTQGTDTVCSTWEVRSTLKATFSWNDIDWDHELDPYMSVSCPQCGKENTVLADTDEDALAYAVEDFTHLTGPYCRCEACETVVRPTITKASNLPEGTWAGDEGDWDDYVERLDYVVEEMEQHLKAHFPDRAEPYHLAAYIGNADWRGRDASATLELTGKSIAEGIRVNSEYTISNGELHCYQDGKVVITCGLSHHDASSSVTITPAWRCDMDDDATIDQDEMADAEVFAKIAEELLCGPQQCFEFSTARKASEQFKKVARYSLAAGIRELMTKLGYETGPEYICDLMDNPTEKPELDLIVYTLFTMEDQVLINKLAPSLILMQAVFTARALKLHLDLEESDAT